MRKLTTMNGFSFYKDIDVICELISGRKGVTGACSNRNFYTFVCNTSAKGVQHYDEISSDILVPKKINVLCQ